MLFSSITFLFYFLPALFVLYYIVPVRFKNLVMILASFVFYAWGEIRFIPVMLALSVEDFICAKLMDKHRDNPRRRKLFMLISVCSNLGVLLYFKYTNFFVTNLEMLTGWQLGLTQVVLPIGVSFNTFQSISYALDVYRGVTPCEKKFYHYLTYTTLFPQIIAGPIVRYVTVENDLDDHLLNRDSLSQGMRRFIIGLGKKVLIANNAGMLWNEIVSGNVGEMSVLLYWLGILAYTFQIYFDFSGYSDMAIGLARAFGFTFDENFDFPYIAKSITEFWRRWHITLGAWFRDYVYIPLGGNRCSVAKHLRNLAIVWGLTGFWHGASWNFMLWGLYFAVLLGAEKYLWGQRLEKLPSFFRHVYTMLFVMVSWVIFYFENLADGVAYLKGMFGLTGAPLWNAAGLYYGLGYAAVFLVAAWCSTPQLRRWLERLRHTRRPWVAGAVTGGYLAIFVLCIAYLVNSTYNPFLYFRF